MKLTFPASEDKESVFKAVANFLREKNLAVASKETNKPWGGFFVIDETDAEKFIVEFFPKFSKDQLSIGGGRLSPKILVVAPKKRLSWQYHHRRAEIWNQIGGSSRVTTSDTDEEKVSRILQNDDIIELGQGERHRLIGLESWGIVAEIWRHTDSSQPSNEDDIVRVQDDFGR